MSEIAPESAAAPSRGTTRRQVLKAGAWAAPAVVMTAALPAAAASLSLVSTVVYVTKGQSSTTGTVAFSPAPAAGTSVTLSLVNDTGNGQNQQLVLASTSATINANGQLVFTVKTPPGKGKKATLTIGILGQTLTVLVETI